MAHALTIGQCLSALLQLLFALDFEVDFQA